MGRPSSAVLAECLARHEAPYCIEGSSLALKLPSRETQPGENSTTLRSVRDRFRSNPLQNSGGVQIAKLSSVSGESFRGFFPWDIYSACCVYEFPRKSSVKDRPKTGLDPVDERSPSRKQARMLFAAGTCRRPGKLFTDSEERLRIVPRTPPFCSTGHK